MCLANFKAAPQSSMLSQGNRETFKLMSAASPSSRPREQIVFQVKNVDLAGKLLSIQIFEVQNSALHKESTIPSSTSASSRFTRSDSGFRVAARDDVDNEYSLFVTRQKAEYLYRVTYRVEADDRSLVTSEAMAAGILAHINIIGNQQRDVFKLVCREPESHVQKKARALPATTSLHQQRNPHLPSKRQDQRAVRMQKTSQRTIEAVAQAMQRSNPDLNREDDVTASKMEPEIKNDRKGSEVSLLHRMAVAGSQEMWKVELETNYEEPEHPLHVEDDKAAAPDEYAITPGSSLVKRALPERKTKHKDLEERRQKGRHHRNLVAPTAQESSSSELLGFIQAQISSSQLFGVIGQDVDSLSPGASKQASLIAESSAEMTFFQSSASSVPRSSVFVDNANGQNSLFDAAVPESEQFLRRQRLGTPRNVLRNGSWPHDIPGMEIEIIDERTSNQSPLNRPDALLNPSHRVMVTDSLDPPLQGSASNVNMSITSKTAALPTLNHFSTALNASHSAPVLQKPKVEESKSDLPANASAALGTPTGTDANIFRPQPRSPSASQPSLGSPVSSMMLPVSFQGSNDDNVTHTENIQKPGRHSIFEGNPKRMQCNLRSHSNSVGSEDVGSSPPLPKTVEAPGQGFLVIRTLEEADQMKIAQEKAEFAPFVFNILVSSSKNFTAETDSLSFQSDDNNDNRAGGGSSLIPRDFISTAFESGNTNELQKTLISTFQPNVVGCSPASRNERENTNDTASTRIADMGPMTEYAIMDGQHISIIESGLVAQLESGTIIMPEEKTSPRLQNKSATLQESLRDVVEKVILDTQFNDRLSDALCSNDNKDQFESSCNDSFVGIGASFRCSTSATEFTVGRIESIADDIDANWSRAKVDEDGIISACSNIASIHVDKLHSIERDADLRCLISPCEGDSDDDNENAIKHLVNEGDENTKTFHYPIADYFDKIATSSFSLNDDNTVRKPHAMTRDDSSLRTDNPNDNPIQAATLTLPSEELVRGTSCAPDEVSNQEREKGVEIESQQVISKQSLRRAHGVMKKQLAILEFTPSNTKARATDHQQSSLEAYPEFEKLSDISPKTSFNLSNKSRPTRKVKALRRSCVAQKDKDASIVDLQRGAEDVLKDDCSHVTYRMITKDNIRSLPELTSAAAKNAVVASDSNKTRRVPWNRHLPQHLVAIRSTTNYHNKWGKWLTSKNIIEKVGCLQLEEAVMADPRNGENVLRLGLRYARWSGTSMPAILLLEHVSLLHKTTTGTRDYWFWLGSAHMNIFMRHRKYMAIARFHLSKSFRAFTNALAFLESLVDPILLLRYAMSLFWHKGDGNLEKTRDVLHELFSQFTTFCDKDRPNLLFFRFQVAHRLKLYTDAIDCMNEIVTLDNTSSTLTTSTDVSLANTISFALYDTVDYQLMLMQCQQASGNYTSAAQSLASALKMKGIQHDTVLKDEDYFDLWSSLAEKCFHHEDYALALEYYAIALKFTKQPQVVADIHYNLGLCFQSLGEDSKCVTEYKRARAANRHVLPLASLIEINTPYDEHFAQLLKKSVVRTIEEVRVKLYGKAVRRLQRIFRKSRLNLKIDVDSDSSGCPVTKIPSLSKRKSVVTAARNVPHGKIEDFVKEAQVLDDENLVQKAAAVVDNQAATHENSNLNILDHCHETFLTKKQTTIYKMTELLTNPQYRGREALPLTCSNPRVRAATQLRSGFLLPERDRLDVRRMQSMKSVSQLGYVASKMPWIELWKKLLALTKHLFESRQALYGSIARIRGHLPLVTDEVAFCALAESIGNVHEAAEKLHDLSYERELTYVCAVIDVPKQLERDFPLKSAQLYLEPPHVFLPTISSPRLHTPVGTVTSSHIVLPSYSSILATTASNFKPKKHFRVSQMLNLHFHEHVQKQEAAIAATAATSGFVRPHEQTEKLMVLHNFRQTNAVFLNSQVVFNSENATA